MEKGVNLRFCTYCGSVLVAALEAEHAKIHMEQNPRAQFQTRDLDLAPQSIGHAVIVVAP